MSFKVVNTGPFLSNPHGRMIYCMACDEGYMQKPAEALGAYERERASHMREDAVPFGLTMAAVGKKGDVVILDERYREMSSFLEWHLAMWKRVGLETAGEIVFCPNDKIYKGAVDIADEGDLVSIECFSHETLRCGDFDRELRVSKMVNSKLEQARLFSEHLKNFPETIFIKKGDGNRAMSCGKSEKSSPFEKGGQGDFITKPIYYKISPNPSLKKRGNFSATYCPVMGEEKLGEIVTAFLSKNGRARIKADGIGGGFNVATVAGLADLLSFIKRYEGEREFILQKEISGSDAREVSHNFLICDDRVEFINSSIQISSDNHYLGNIILPALCHPERQRRIPLQLRGVNSDDLTNCCNSIKNSGYSSPHGFICGIDTIIADGRQYILEANARWTGGLPYYRILDLLNCTDRPAVCYYDRLSADKIGDYQSFFEEYLYDGEAVIPAPCLPAGREAGIPLPSRDPSLRWDDRATIPLRYGVDGKKFSLLPVSFSPIVRDGIVLVSFVVIGDYRDFFVKKRRRFGARTLKLDAFMNASFTRALHISPVS